MSSFNRDFKSGGDKFGRKGNSFSSNKRFGDRDGGGKAFLYDATCAKCGKACQVPFKPAGGRPVFCSNCFDKPVNGNQPRPLTNNFARPRFDDKQMHEATCAKCGNKCQVPFRPVDGKPVFCSNCFEKKSSAGGNSDQFKGQFAALNAKLDAILRALNSAPTAPQAAKAVKEVKEPKKTKTPSAKTKTAKKAATKKNK